MVAEIDDAQVAYDAWKREHKLMLKVYTDEETFKIGYWLGAKDSADLMLKRMKEKNIHLCAPTKSTTKTTKSSASSTGKTKPKDSSKPAGQSKSSKSSSATATAKR